MSFAPITSRKMDECVVSTYQKNYKTNFCLTQRYMYPPTTHLSLKKNTCKVTHALRTYMYVLPDDMLV